jgi:asparagine synthase (glutamine-hydrolysing)
MCGIIAVVSRDQPLSSDVLQRGIDSLYHRGPDGAGYWVSADRQAGLGHTRLSIIDLVSGQQPIANERGSIHAVVNGEFYGYESVRDELLARGHQLATRSDSEIAIHLFEENGIDCVSELRGEFAFALWDDRAQTLYAVRDRFGIKPLYYTEQGNQLWIASEIKALAAMGAKMDWDERSLSQSFYANPGPQRTLFKGVRQVPPGCYLRANSTGTVVRPYWEMDFPREGAPSNSRTDEDWIDSLRSQTSEAVRLRLRADVPVGALLSGGLDSSATLGLARTHTQGAIKAFTIAFDHPDYDESPVARLSAKTYEADFYPIRVTSDDFAAVFETAVWHSEGVHYNAHGAARFILSRSVRDNGVKVVLAGEGADEISAGYRFFDSAFGATGVNPPIQWPAGALRALTPDPECNLSGAPNALEGIAKALNFPFSMVANMVGKRAFDLGILDRGFAARNAKSGGALAFFRQFDIARQIDGREPVRQLMHFWMGSGFANYVLGGERLDMAHGVEQRLPFLDHVLFEHARNIPVSLLRRDGREKWVLREALRPFVSPQVYDRKKQPFFAPPLTLQDGSAMLALAQDMLRSETMRSIPFFSHSSVVRLLDEIPRFTSSERALLDPLFLMMMSFQVLQDRYVRQQRPMSPL